MKLRGQNATFKLGGQNCKIVKFRGPKVQSSIYFFMFDENENKMFSFFRVALQFVHDLQERADKNFEASRDRSLPMFGVGVVFI
jgi:hypothetical protein